jgi:putative DNA primase/helicase
VTTNDGDEALPRAQRRPLGFDPATVVRKIKERPTIIFDPGAIDEVATTAEQALIATGQIIYQQGSMLVRPVMMKVSASKGRETAAPALKALDPDSLVDHLARAAQWERPDARRRKTVPCTPPRLVASILLTRVGEWSFPQISGIVTAPTMRPNGSLITNPGYDPQTRLYYMADPGLRIPMIFGEPSREDAEAALHLLQDLLGGFPFKRSLDFSVALSALMSPFVRGACSVAPLHGFSSHEAGTGMSHLCDLIATIITGRWCPVVAQSRSAEETEKQLTGLLLAGQPIISIDNVMRELSSPLLCQAVERPLLQVRPLGSSIMMMIENHCTFFATGNNLIIAGDMVRRSIRSELDAGVEQPETRSFAFDPIARVMADRGKYIAAVLTIIRAYQAAARHGERVEVTPFQGFNEWSRYVREPLVWLGLADPVESVAEVRRSDPERMRLRALLTAWEDVFGNDPMTAAKAIATVQESFSAQGNDSTVVDLRAALQAVATERGGTISQRRLGNWLAHHKGRIIDGMQFLDDGVNRSGVALWYIARTDGTAPTKRRSVFTYQEHIANLSEARRARQNRTR